MAIESAQPAILTNLNDSVAVDVSAAASQTDGGGSVVVGDLNNSIYIRRFGSDGQPLAAATKVNTNSNQTNADAHVATNAAGRTVVVWFTRTSGGDESIVGRIYNNDGTPATGEFAFVGPLNNAGFSRPRVGIDSSGRFVTTYQQPVGDDTKVFYDRRNASNVSINSDVFIVADIANPTAEVAVAPTGEYAITFVNESSGQTDIGFAAWNASGTVLTSSTPGPAVTGDIDESSPQIVALGNVGWGITWAGSDDGADATVHFRAYSYSAAALTAARQISQDSLGNRTEPKIAANASGDFTIGWTQQGDGEAYSSTVFRSYDHAFSATSNETPIGDGFAARTLVSLVQVDGGSFAELAKVGETLGSGDGTLAGYDNVLRIDGTSGADQVSVTRTNDGGTSIRVKLNGVVKNYLRTAYERLHVELGAGNDVFEAGRASDGGTVLEVPVSVLGGDGNDSISGGLLGDSLFGEAGADTLSGNGSKDYIVGGADNDRMYGGDGNDNLVGGAGKNTFYGEAGDDRLSGSGGHDTMFGGDGSDRLYGGAGNDSLDGGGGTDRLYADDGNDILYGGSSNDRLYGDAGDDTLNGGKGTDYLFGGANTDTRTGAEASDVLDSIERTR